MTEKNKPVPRTSARKPAQPAAKPVQKKLAVAAVGAEKVEPIVPPAKPAKEKKSKKLKMVRDSFTMPQDDYAHIAALKERCRNAGGSAKKSEILRAALLCLARLSDEKLTQAIGALKVSKTGRPVKG